MGIFLLDNKNKIKAATHQYVIYVETFLKDRLDKEGTVNFDIVNTEDREKIGRLHYFHLNKYNRVLYSGKKYLQTLFFSSFLWEVDILPVKYYIIVSKRYHENADKSFLRYCDYVGILQRKIRFIGIKWYC